MLTCPSPADKRKDWEPPAFGAREMFDKARDSTSRSHAVKHPMCTWCRPAVSSSPSNSSSYSSVSVSMNRPHIEQCMPAPLPPHCRSGARRGRRRSLNASSTTSSSISFNSMRAHPHLAPGPGLVLRCFLLRQRGRFGLRPVGRRRENRNNPRSRLGIARAGGHPSGAAAKA